MLHDPTALIASIAVVAIVLAVVVLVVRARRQRQTLALREHFGPEYERVLAEQGDVSRAERELLARKKRLDELDIRLLSAEECERFGAAWGSVQQRFVDDPNGAVTEADGLVKEVMRVRGYPVGNFDQRVADLSVEHGNVVQHYRSARTIAEANERGQATTEDLRQAMVYYRALFYDLLQTRTAPAATSLREARA